MSTGSYGGYTIQGLTDVKLPENSQIPDGDTLVWNATEKKWINDVGGGGGDTIANSAAAGNNIYETGTTEPQVLRTLFPEVASGIILQEDAPLAGNIQLTNTLSAKNIGGIGSSGLFTAKTPIGLGADLDFKSLRAGDGIFLTGSATEVEIENTKGIDLEAAPHTDGDGLIWDDENQEFESRALDASDIQTGTHPEVRGGTGESTYTQGDILVGDAGSGLAKLIVGADNTVLKSTGVGATPEWAAVDYTELTSVPATFAPSAHTHDTSDITTGTLGEARGGSGESTYTHGDLLVGDAGNGLTKLIVGADNTVLKSTGVGATPEWANVDYTELTNVPTDLLTETNSKVVTNKTIDQANNTIIQNMEEHTNVTLVNSTFGAINATYTPTMRLPNNTLTTVSDWGADEIENNLDNVTGCTLATAGNGLQYINIPRGAPPSTFGYETSKTTGDIPHSGGFTFFMIIGGLQDTTGPGVEYILHCTTTGAGTTANQDWGLYTNNTVTGLFVDSAGADNSANNLHLPQSDEDFTVMAVRYNNTNLRYYSKSKSAPILTFVPPAAFDTAVTKYFHYGRFVNDANQRAGVYLLDSMVFNSFLDDTTFGNVWDDYESLILPASLSANQIMKYSGSAWENKPHNLETLNDVNPDGGLGLTTGDRLTGIPASANYGFITSPWNNISLVNGAIVFEDFVTPLTVVNPTTFTLVPFVGVLQTGAFLVSTNGLGRLTNDDSFAWSMAINFSCALTGNNATEWEVALFVNGSKVSNSYLTTVASAGRYNSLSGIWVQQINGSSVTGPAVANQYVEIFIKRNVGSGDVDIGSAFLSMSALKLLDQPSS